MQRERNFCTTQRFGEIENETRGARTVKGRKVGRVGGGYSTRAAGEIRAARRRCVCARGGCLGNSTGVRTFTRLFSTKLKDSVRAVAATVVKPTTLSLSNLARSLARSLARQRRQAEVGEWSEAQLS